MIGKPEWFTYRFGGWGLRPRTWQGWVYVAGLVAAFVLISLLSVPERVKEWCFWILAGLALLDVLDIMIRMGAHHDERERFHQLIIERNCSFAALAGLLGAGAFQAYQRRATAGSGFPFDPWILVVLVVMAVTKLASSLYVRRKL
jgi:hypothetical protein